MGNACVAGEPLVVDDAGTLVLLMRNTLHDPRNRGGTDRDGIGHPIAVAYLSVYMPLHCLSFD